jgi:hypothetical protein
VGAWVWPQKPFNCGCVQNSGLRGLAWGALAYLLAPSAGIEPAAKRLEALWLKASEPLIYNNFAWNNFYHAQFMPNCFCPGAIHPRIIRE